MLPVQTDPTAPTTQQLQETAVDVASVLLGVLGGAAVGLVVGLLVHALVRFLLRRHAPARHLLRRARRPFGVAVMVLGVRLGLQLAIPQGTEPRWVSVLYHLLTISLIATLVWVAVALIAGFEDVAKESYGGEDVVRGSRARRLQTQAQLLNRVATAVVITIGVAAILLTFPGARTIGTSILASAGIASVVVGLAAQSVLSNLFAGLQIAFTDSLRIDDTVMVEGELGNVEEITLTYVVVRIWDERRMILPSSYFTTTPFQNYTRTDPAMTGTVEIDVDWSAPIAALRGELARILAICDAWDGRTGDLEVVEATGGRIRLRVAVSAADNGKLWTVRVTVREGLTEWLQENAPYAIVKQHMVEHELPAAWAWRGGLGEDAEQDLAELVRAARDERRETTFERDMRAVTDGQGSRPGETARWQARAARKQAEREDRRRAKEHRGALGRAEQATWMASPSATTTRVLRGMPPAEELPEPPSGEAQGDPYGAVPHDLENAIDGAPQRRSVRDRLAALGRTVRPEQAAAETRIHPTTQTAEPEKP